ncbi:MAG TPA: hypothetical protein VM513_00880 [Kofleriaceae bacterium]|nr:hypothetical protein [Kofleriaceae bacterium]
MRAAVFVFVVAGCSEPVDLSGMYRVDTQVASSPCGDDRQVAVPIAYVRFNRGEFLGAEFYAYDECKDAEGTDCLAAGGLFEGFYEQLDDGWLGRTSFASGGAGFCSLSITSNTARLRGQKLTVDSTTHGYDGEVPDGACTNEEAEARGEDMECMRHTRLEATRL